MARNTVKKRATQELPPLDSGDRLTRSEFERRYLARPDIRKAELIEGIVYVASPVRARLHGRPHAKIMIWLGHYELATPGVEVYDNTTLRMDIDNEPQPDVLLRLTEDRGGQSRVDGDDYLAGAPELIVEVAGSSASYDLGAKKNAYRRNGVREYVVWRVFDDQIDWFVLQDGTYAPAEPSADGILRSRVFPGLWLDPQALLEGDLARVMEALDAGLASPDHATFKASCQRSS